MLIVVMLILINMAVFMLGTVMLRVVTPCVILCRVSLGRLSLCWVLGHQFLKILFVFKVLCWDIVLWERMLRHQRNWRIWNPSNLIDSLFIKLICITKNTQVFNFSFGHFWPTPLPFLSNPPSLTLLICCSLSLSLSPSLLTPHSISPVTNSHKHLNTALILWDGIIEYIWLKVNGCFTCWIGQNSFFVLFQTLFSNLFVTLNSSINLFIYCTFGKKFRFQTYKAFWFVTHAEAK